MELINKKDAIHAVLHHHGDAAVAAVQEIMPINPHGELREMLIDEMIDKGEWKDEQRGRWIYAKCNLCGKVQDVRSNYCPNCGARMDGERKDGERDGRTD